MKTKLLLPHRFQWIGVLVLIPFLTLGILWRFFDFSFDFLTLEHGFSIISVPTSLNLSEKINLTDELALTGIIAGLLLIAFSRQKQEDEFIH